MERMASRPVAPAWSGCGSDRAACSSRLAEPLRLLAEFSGVPRWPSTRSRWAGGATHRPVSV